MVRERAIDVTTGLKGKFVELPRRPMVQLECDLTTDAPDDLSYEGVADALVKIKIRHWRGSEENANKMVASTISNCRKNGAYHIFRPELVVVGDGDTRMPELTVATKPMEAVRMWLKQRAPTTVNKREVADLLEDFLSRVPDTTADREHFLPFVIRAIGGKNFQPFKGDFGIYQIPDGVFEITGSYINQEGRSNRSGKSALLETLLFVLTGRARKVRSVDKYIHKGQDSANAFVELIDHKGDQVRIDRNINGSTTSVLINGQHYRVRDADDYIRQNIVGLGSDDIVRTCIVQQNDLHGLLGLTSAEIQKDLVRWFGVSIWKQVEILVASEQDDLEKSQYGLAIKLEQLEQQMEDNIVEDVEISRVREELQIAEDKISGVAEMKLQIRSLEDRIAIAQKVVTAQSDFDQTEAVDSELQKCETGLAGMKHTFFSQSMKMGAVDSKLKEARSNLSKFDGMCPVDNGKCSRTKDINKNTPKIEKLIAKLEAERNDFFDDQVTAEKAIKELDAKVSKLQEQDRIRKQAKEILDEHGPDYEDEDVLIRELAARREAMNDEGNTQEVHNLRSELSRLQASREIHDRAIFARRRTGEEINTIDYNLSVLRYARLMVGKVGIPSMQIENGVKELEAQANSILAQVGTDHRLAFSFETELKKKATACYECGRPFQTGERKCDCGAERGKEKSDQMSVMVIDNGIEFEFGQDSGGGQDLLAIAVRIAAARMLGAPILATDEVCASLDSENLRTYLTMLRGLSSIGFRQVFDVSHRPEVAEALDRNILITRYPDENRSTVGWE